MKQILNFIFNEGHCVHQWGGFWKEYLKLGDLQCIIPNTIPFFITSATLPPVFLIDIGKLLHVCPKNTERFLMLTDYPDLWIMAQPFVYPLNSFKDLAFLIPEGVSKDSPLSKFIIFFDDTRDMEDACEWLQNQLPASLRLKIGYFHSTMTQSYRENKVDALKESEAWGYMATQLLWNRSYYTFTIIFSLSHLLILSKHVLI